MVVYKVENKTFPSNTYIIASGTNGECWLIDPGLDEEAIETKLEELHLQPTDILATHGHFDHVSSVTYFQKKYKAKFYIHELDLKILKSINFFLKVMKIDRRVEVPAPDYILKGKSEKLHMQNGSIEVYNFPGHTDGSCFFKIDNILFSGDTLYSRGIGVNPFPGQDKIKLKASLQEVIELLSDDSITVYPGHGNSELLSKIKSDNKELNLFLETS